jgi:Tol biopolymer transport system component
MSLCRSFAQRPDLRKIPTGPGEVSSPGWSPDGHSIVFARQQGEDQFLIFGGHPHRSACHPIALGLTRIDGRRSSASLYKIITDRCPRYSLRRIGLNQLRGMDAADGNRVTASSLKNEPCWHTH